MSVDYYSYLIFGYKLDDAKVVNRERGCEHPETNTKCCPECGKAMWVEYSVCLIELFEDCDFHIPWKKGIGWITGTDGEPLFIGCIGTLGRNDWADVSDLVKICTENTEEFKAKIQEYVNDNLSQFNLELGEPKFWLMQYCSY
jgi:hypothetical protein